MSKIIATVVWACVLAVPSAGAQPASHHRPACERFPVVTRAQHRPQPGPPPQFFEVRVVVVSVRKCPGRPFKLVVRRGPWHQPNR